MTSPARPHAGLSFFTSKGRFVDRQPIRRALVSVFDKTGIEQLATMLDKAGVDVVSTGSTAKALTDAGLKVTEVSTVTGFPEHAALSLHFT